MIQLKRNFIPFITETFSTISNNISPCIISIYSNFCSSGIKQTNYVNHLDNFLSCYVFVH